MQSRGTDTITIRVVPKAKRQEVKELDEGIYKVWVNAPPDKGKANKAVIKAMAGFLGISKTRLKIIRGHNSRDKVLEVQGV